MPDINENIDLLEAILLDNFPTVDCPLIHKFLPGLYIREILMPESAVVTSQIHKTKHPFFVLQGKVSVFSENDGEQFIEAPFWGVTKPNTRRVLRIHENTVWITIHRTDRQPKDDSQESLLEAVALVEDDIIEKHENSLIGGAVKNNFINYKEKEQICPSSQSA
jgi:hypothetical protein